MEKDEQRADAGPDEQHRGVRYIDPFHDPRALAPIGPEERALLRTVNQKIAARPSLRDIIDYLFERTQSLIPCDRIGLAFVDQNGERVTSYYNRASYPGMVVEKDYAEALRGSSLEEMLRTGQPRIIDDLETYLTSHPRSRSTQLLLREGVRSSLTCPLTVEGRVVGFLFRSSREPHTYTTHHIELQMAIAERLSQAVETAWRIEQLQESNNAYAQMLGFVSHQLKSPIAAMVTDARLLAQGYLGQLDDDQIAKAESIVHKGEFLLSLVAEYLDLARVDGGDPHAVFRPYTNVNDDLVAEAVSYVRPQIEARGMKLTLELADPSPQVCCDPTLLRIVLINLLDNAVKYGVDGGAIRIAASLTAPRRDGRRRLAVSVWNEGPGFSAADRNKLFRRFSRLDDPVLRSHPGTGIGLYSAWRIVQLHRGRFTADSKHGEWAQFSFEIPATPECPELADLLDDQEPPSAAHRQAQAEDEP
jgi:signal transduction histidine kinase